MQAHLRIRFFPMLIIATMAMPLFQSAQFCRGANDAGTASEHVIGGVVVAVGEPKTVIPPGKELRYFPDEPVCVIKANPLTFTLVNGRTTLLMSGKSFETAASLGEVLGRGKQGEFDNGYAGISGVYHDNRNGELIAIYHAEDHEEMPLTPGNDVPGFYASIGLAISTDDGRTFKKLGQIVTVSLPKNPKADVTKGGSAQGVGDASLCLNADGQYLYMYYMDLSRVDDRCCQVCMARCKLSDGGRPGKWRKFHDGRFDEPGLDGKDTPVVQMRNPNEDAISPNVTYVAGMKKYFMVFGGNVYADIATKNARTSGIYCTTSDDGVKWADPVLLFTGLTVPVPGAEFAARPGLVLTDTQQKTVIGWLYYAYSPKWGHTDQEPPHYMAGRPVRLSIKASQ
jgi:hypothetical protein